MQCCSTALEGSSRLWGSGPEPCGWTLPSAELHTSPARAACSPAASPGVLALAWNLQGVSCSSSGLHPGVSPQPHPPRPGQHGQQLCSQLGSLPCPVCRLFCADCSTDFSHSVTPAAVCWCPGKWGIAGSKVPPLPLSLCHLRVRSNSKSQDVPFSASRQSKSRSCSSLTLMLLAALRGGKCSTTSVSPVPGALESQASPGCHGLLV